MFNVLVVLVMFGILISLGSGLYFLLQDRGKSNRIVISLSVRVALSFLLLALLAFGFAGNFISLGG